MSYIIDSQLLSQVTDAEKRITKKDGPVSQGPTARVQSHVHKELTAEIIREVTEAEKALTGSVGPNQGGPTSVLQRVLTTGSLGTKPNSNGNATANSSNPSEDHSGTLDSATLSKITAAEKKITGEDHAVKDGPTAKAQSHAKEPITSQVLHDITEGEKNITGGERVKGGPTSTAQSELGKSRS
ncbi:uncharacterized protein K489DRAFT_377505 [Dissoconium aciculare CBS 342.82]|uniref:SMP domain-containing protein n=1 Tax=Dissoconium aciculare CBS 342.82 TaxID=1314786 RepID=A0A6J3MBG3_9PEZI|nr:uncharacterized protein K489DRAFT_377505 [Dissoconium aciculare CBS 342.82]KAF1824969.1 hypothetical protein K489DRAFT_377505 [Dissoconium aciculare CBS 342.82]